MYKNQILILDFGSQYTQLIARRIRELGVYCEVWTWNITKQQICEFRPMGIILSGGPKSITKYNSPHAPQYVFEAGVPVLGICYGMQTMAIQLGGHVISSENCEFGYARVTINVDNPLTHGIYDSLTQDNKPLLEVWMSYNDKITTIPSGFTAVANTKTCQYAIIINQQKQLYGVQFHPEVTHTKQGLRILKRFVLEICKCKVQWTSVTVIKNIVQNIRRQVGNDKVILGFSGGIDSYVTAILLHRAIGSNLTCIFVDNGLLRFNEGKQVVDIFKKFNNINIISIQAEELFLSALKGEIDPEKKRIIIGNTFVKVFDKEALKIKNVKWLAQGTIYPDVIESAFSDKNKSTTHVIKSHHNVGAIPQNMKIRLLEPLKKLFKDEVRKIGIELKLPNSIIYRHPFPGPGLGIRILGEIKKEYCDILRYADAIFIDELKKADLYSKISQAFTVFLPIRSIGIMGDDRKYDWVIALRAVETIDFMTANCAQLPYDFLIRVSNRITNEIRGISRVVYDISSKPPATIEWE